MSTANTYKICYIKCDTADELDELSKCSSAGLPYVPLWSQENMRGISNFPIYVRMQISKNVGYIASEASYIKPDIPSDLKRDIPIFEFPVFKNFICH